MNLMPVGLAASVGVVIAGSASAQRPAAVEGLDRLKALAGEWEAPGPDGGAVRVIYEVISGGTAVLERVMGDEHGGAGMVSVYHLKGGRLAMSHFCTGGSQPRFESAGLAGDSLDFALEPESLSDPGRGHIHRVAFRFDGPARVTTDWDWVEGGVGGHRLTRRQTRVAR
ncbi:MAG: hypothetical protein ACKVZ0_16760 [Gemmatimonadales bacterium]